jgi:hypothetical protein
MLRKLLSCAALSTPLFLTPALSTPADAKSGEAANAPDLVRGSIHRLDHSIEQHLVRALTCTCCAPGNTKRPHYDDAVARSGDK